MKIGPFEISRKPKSPVQKRSWSELHSFFDQTEGYTTDGKSTIRSQLDEYRSWIMIACNVIHRRVSEIDYKFFRDDINEEIKPKNSIYKTINKIFKDPNPVHEFRFIKGWTQLQLDLTGMAFILRIDDAFGLPYQLWPLNVNNFHKLEKGSTFDTYIEGFTFRVGGEFITYDPKNILYFHYCDPKDPRDGCSPVKSQALVVETDHFIEVYESDFFKNSARPDVMLKYPENVEIEEESADRIIASWKKKFRGEGKMHEIAIMDRGAEVEKLNVMNSDLALTWLAEWSMDKILSAYTVPKGKVGIMKDINKSSSQSIEETFNRECILPRLRLFDEVISRGVMQKFDERLVIKHDNPVPRDKEELIKEHKEKVGVPSVTINESREKDGLKPVDGGDVVYVPLNYVGLGSNAPPPEGPEKPEGPEGEEPEGETQEPKKIQYREQYSEDWLTRKWHVFKAYTEGWEGVWRTQLGRLFEAQQEEVIRNLESWWDRAKGVFDECGRIKMSLKAKLPAFMEEHRGESTEDIVRYFERSREAVEKVAGAGELGVAGIVMEALIRGDDGVLLRLADHMLARQTEAIDHIVFDWDDNMRAFSKAGKQLTGSIIQEQANEELVGLGMDASFTLENKMARTYLADKVRRFSDSVLATKRTQLERTLGRGFKAGEGVRQLTRRVQDVYGSVLRGGYEAVRIARTETVSASNAGSVMGYHSSGVVKEKGWLAARDQRTRGADPDDIADHWNMDGDRVKLNEAFTDPRTGARMMQPGDSSLGAGGEDLISCRCTIVPYTTSTTRVKDATVDDFLDERDLGAVGTARGRRAIRGCYA